MQGWANTDSNDRLFHAFAEGESGLRALCSKRIRPAERHRRGDLGLSTEEQIRGRRFPSVLLCERCSAKATALTETATVGETGEAAEEDGRAFVVDEEALGLFADVTPDARPSLGEELVITRADRVRFGDTVFGCLLDTVGAAVATLRHVIMHSDPYIAAPRPYDSACGCLGCAQAASLPGPVITLAIETPWEACDPVPAASLVLVRRGRRATGSAPRDIDNPDALAALAALGSLRLATVTDEHDLTGLDKFDAQARGALVEPRGSGRVAVYWLAEGLYVAGEDRAPHRIELRGIADRLRGAGWRIEPGSVRCVLAWRPSAEA
ncbi:hypothetical protein [Streptomyces formicae]